jgi:hypothetical protein
MHRRRLTKLAGIAITGAALAGIPATTAQAHGPVGGCPPPYELSAIADAPPFIQPSLTAQDQKGNGDGYLCRMPFPGHAATAIGAPYNVIDNHDVGAGA